jgi:hypothetical protein
MSIAFVRNNGTGTPSVTTAVASNAFAMTNGYTAGDFIAVWAFSFSSAISSITDSLGNSYTNVLSVASNGGSDVSSLWVCASAIAGTPTITVTFTTTSGWNSICVSEFSGVNATVDKTATFTGTTSTTISTGTTAATSHANELVLALLESHQSAAGAGETCSTPTGFTALPSIVADNLAGNQFFDTFPFYQIVSATGAQGGSGTVTLAPVDTNGLIATFPASAGAAGGRLPNTPTLPTLPSVG